MTPQVAPPACCRAAVFVLALGPQTVLAACPAPTLDHGAHAAGETFVVEGANALRLAVADANAGLGTQILIRPGTYELGEKLVITRRGLTIRGATGARDDVVLRGLGPAGATTHVFLVEAADFTLADMTVGWVQHHAVQVRGELDADRPRFSNVRFADTGQQLLKVSGADATDNASDQGIVEGSLFEHSSGVAHSWYTAGIDVHRGQGWVVRDNVFRGIRSPESRLAEHAIHFWTGAAHTVIERNVITTSDRGIGLGLGDRGHVGGIVRNNFVSVVRDVGIGLENTSDALVAHNTVMVRNYPNAIEYRFDGTRDVRIANNLANASITSRDGGEAIVVGNVTTATPEWFADAANGDLRLAAARPGLVDEVGALAQVDVDIDCNPRPHGALADVGAHEIEASVDGSLARADGDSGALYGLVRQAGHGLSVAMDRMRGSPTLMAVAAGTVLAIVVGAVLLLRVLRIRPPPQRGSGRRRRRSGGSGHPAIRDVPPQG